MKVYSRIILVTFLGFMSAIVSAQFFYGTGEAVNLEERIRFNQSQIAVETGSGAPNLDRPVGSIRLDSSLGMPYVKTDTGDTNWSRLSDYRETFNLYKDSGFRKDETVSNEVFCFNGASAVRSTTQNFGDGAGSLRMGLDFGYRCNHIQLTTNAYPEGSPLTIAGYFYTPNLAAEICPVIGNVVQAGDCVKANEINTWTPFLFTKESSSLDGYAIRCPDAVECNDPTEYVYVDAVFLGVDSTRNLQPISEAYFIGSISRAGASDCQQTVSSGTFTSFANDTNCNDLVPSGNLKINSSNAKGWGFILPKSSKKGTYLVQYKTLGTLTNAGACQYRLFSTNITSSINATRRQVDSTVNLLDKSFEIKLEQALSEDVEFFLQARQSNGTPDCDIDGRTRVGDTIATVSYFPDAPTLVGKDFCADPRDCETVFSGTVNNTFNGLDTSSLPSFFGAVTNPSAGVIRIAVNGLSETPLCSVSDRTTNASRNVSYVFNNSSSTIIEFATRTLSSNTQENGTFSFTCQRTGQDYLNAKIRNIIGNFDAKNLRGGVSYGENRKKVKATAYFAGASVTSNCDSSPCGKYEAEEEQLSLSLTRSGTGEYSLAVTGGKEGTKPRCFIQAQAVSSGGRITTYNQASAIFNSSGEAVIDDVRTTSRNDTTSALNSRIFVECTGDRL